MLPNVLLHNQEGKRFVDISTSSGTGALAKGHGVAFADLENSGDEDIFILMGGPSPAIVMTAASSRILADMEMTGSHFALSAPGQIARQSALESRLRLKIHSTEPEPSAGLLEAADPLAHPHSNSTSG